MLYTYGQDRADGAGLALPAASTHHEARFAKGQAIGAALERSLKQRVIGRPFLLRLRATRYCTT